jgi:hypothetical protein
VSHDGSDVDDASTALQMGQRILGDRVDNVTFDLFKPSTPLFIPIKEVTNTPEHESV